MFLRSISTEELNFEKSWNLGLKKIKNLSRFDKYMTIFWLLGPFIFLIERTPADIWLTFLSIIFLVRCFLKKDWSWASQLWFRLALLFWGFSLFSASISPDPFFRLVKDLYGSGFLCTLLLPKFGLPKIGILEL